VNSFSEHPLTSTNGAAIWTLESAFSVNKQPGGYVECTRTGDVLKSCQAMLWEKLNNAPHPLEQEPRVIS